VTTSECPHCGEEDPRHAPQDCWDNPWFEVGEEEEIEFLEDEALREFEARLKTLTQGLYARMGCDEGILITNGVKGHWFRCLADANTWLDGWNV
jgi:hypothetical protein